MTIVDSGNSGLDLDFSITGLFSFQFGTSHEYSNKQTKQESRY